MSDTTVTIETPVKDHKVRNFIKKITPTKSQLKAAAVGAGIALAGAAVATAFAFKRQDEEDFDDEFEPTDPDTSDDNVAIES